jgi:cob(I)alamin adenosyltransferase
MPEKGLTHVYTGSSKGKTTAAFGLAIRALGNGMKVLVVQFLKGGGRLSGEAAFLSKVADAEVICFADQRHPIFSKDKDGNNEALVASIRRGFETARDKILSGAYGLVILDEINNCMREGWLDVREVVKLIDGKPESVELVLTGRGCPQEIIDAADYVTEMQVVKHPAQGGVKARKGIEF